MKSRHHFLFFLVIILGLFLLVFSSEIRTTLFKNTQIDTVGHFIGFFCLTWILHSLAKFPLFTTVITLIVYAALTEVGQHFLGFRNGEFRDFAADVVGILFFALLKWIHMVYWKKGSL